LKVIVSLDVTNMWPYKVALNYIKKNLVFLFHLADHCIQSNINDDCHNLNSTCIQGMHLYFKGIFILKLKAC